MGLNNDDNSTVGKNPTIELENSLSPAKEHYTIMSYSKKTLFAMAIGQKNAIGDAPLADMVTRIPQQLGHRTQKWGTTAPAVQGLLVLHGRGRKYFTKANRQDATANFTVLRIVSSCSFKYIKKIRFGLDPKIQRSRFWIPQIQQMS
jgi:hypothetical protein